MGQRTRIPGTVALYLLERENDMLEEGAGDWELDLMAAAAAKPDSVEAYGYFLYTHGYSRREILRKMDEMSRAPREVK